MNNIKRIISNSSIMEVIDDEYIKRGDWNKDVESLIKETIRETVKMLDKNDPDFNAFSRKLVETHFGFKL